MTIQNVSQELGNYLVSTGKLSASELQQSMDKYEVLQNGLGSLLTKTGLVSDQDIAQAYSELLELPLYKELDTIEFPQGSFREMFLRSSEILPVSQDKNSITAVIANPEDSFSIDALALSTGKTVALQIGTRQAIHKGLDLLYGNEQSQMDGIIEGLDEEDVHGESGFIDQLLDQAAQAPIVRLVNLILQRAVEARASDIHIEPFENQLKVRYRIDGILQVTESPPAHSSSAIISRIKLMAKMNVAERRLPQDGAIQLRVQGKIIDLRVSTTPTLHGESLVLRILDQNNIALDLQQLGFSDEHLTILNKTLEAPNGIVLVTGPTGSGKSTSLYAALKLLNTDQRKIMTVEDPVEYQLTGINQIQTKADIGLDFAKALRSIVRQDPDIIMIGEMRDLETAKTAVQSALTGHLVLSTLHTNDVGSSITRLLDMGIEDYLVTSTVNVIIAQRLVRKLCELCKDSYIPHLELAEKLQLATNTKLFKATGCPHCDQTGFKGRTVIAEMCSLSDTIKQAIIEGKDADTLQRIARSEGMTNMSEDGVNKAVQGITTIEEVARVCYL